jgi:hypothetical protein
MSHNPTNLILMALAKMQSETATMSDIKAILMYTIAALIKESQQLTRGERSGLTQMLLEAGLKERTKHLTPPDTL